MAVILAALGVTALIYSSPSAPAPHATRPAAGASATAASAAVTPDTQRSSAPSPPTTGAAGATSTAPPTSASGPAEPDGGQDAAALQQALDRTSAPDLPAAASSALIADARANLRSQLSAAGNAAGLVVLAAIARGHNGRTDVADVTVLYSVQDPANPQPEYEVVFAYARTGSGWVPVTAAASAAP